MPPLVYDGGSKDAAGGAGGRGGTGGSTTGGSTGGTGGGNPALVIYPDPVGLGAVTNLSRSSLYGMTVNGQPTFVYRSKNRVPANSAVKEAHFAYFSFANQPVTIEVTKLTGAIGAAQVRPRSLGITLQIAASKLTFVLPLPRKFMVQIDGDDMPLVVFADHPDVDVPAGANVQRFGPGFHDIGRNYNLAENQIVYIDGGAVVKGTFGTSSPMRKNITLRGRGIVYAGDYPWPGNNSSTFGKYGIFHQALDSGRIEGIIALDSEYWTFGIANQNTLFENIKIIGWEKNTDGIWFGPGSTIRDCFIMTDDDSLRPVTSPSYPDSSTTVAENLVIWHQAWGRALFLPAHKLNAPYVQNITYRNIEFIRSEHAFWGQSFIPALPMPGAKIRNILFENITFEEIITPKGVVNHGDFFSWDVAPGSSISNMTFRNVHTPVTKGTMSGLSQTENISGISFDGLYRNGVKMTSLQQMGLTTNQFVDNVTFR